MVLPLYLQRRLEVKKDVKIEVIKEEIKKEVVVNKNVVKKVVKKIDNIPEEDFEEPTIIYKNLSRFFFKK
jgi:hypothetical protein